MQKCPLSQKNSLQSFSCFKKPLMFNPITLNISMKAIVTMSYIPHKVCFENLLLSQFSPLGCLILYWLSTEKLFLGHSKAYKGKKKKNFWSAECFLGKEILFAMVIPSKQSANSTRQSIFIRRWSLKRGMLMKVLHYYEHSNCSFKPNTW